MEGESRAELIQRGQLTDAGDNLGNERLAWSQAESGTEK